MARLIDARPDRATGRDYERAIAEAAEVIRRGGLLGFPTETVYGLGADALCEAAAARVYEVKNRPRDAALIILLAGTDDAWRYVLDAPPVARRLAGRFWPGPLTLIMKRAPVVPAVTAGGKASIALRVPAHPVALDLIRAAGRPVVGPSANRSGRPSPLSAADVLAELGEEIEAVLDAGPAPLGIESTVLDLTAAPPRIVRPGPVTSEELAPYLGELAVAGQDGRPLRAGVRGDAARPDNAGGQASAGRAVPIVLVDLQPGRAAAEAAWRLAGRELASGRRPGLLLTAEGWAARPGAPRGGAGEAGIEQANPVARAAAGGAVAVVLGPRADLAGIAMRLYAGIRALEDEGCAVIYAEPVERRGVGVAVMDRLYKAAGEVVSG